MKNNIKKLVVAITTLVMGISLVGCGSSKSNDSAVAENDGVITIKYPTFRVGVQLSAQSENQLIEEFNKKYEGKYKLEVEELPSDQSYIDKMKVLAASNELPDVVEGKDGIIELAIKNGQAIDLTDYVNADPEYKETIGNGAIEANTRDGKLYSISNAKQLIGYFYNKELFNQVGITPAKTWDEFMSNCEKLKAAGITPISMMTGENCWSTNLLLGAMIGTANEDGNKLMKTKYPESYETPEVVEALNRMKTILKDYTTKDALGAGYATAANHFLQGKTAMMPNGTWMAVDFGDTEKAIEGMADNVGVAMYPNDGLFTQYEIGYVICAKDKAHQEAAFEWIKFKTNREAQLLYFKNTGTLPTFENLVDTQEFQDYKQVNPVVAELVEQANNAKYTFNTVDNISYSSVIGEMSKYYPSLAMGDVSAEDMVKAMTEAVARNK
ncbi:extracellular solute-binding protein [Clostridium sediminicola]|uniref:ABC transporter substrate-binding protein n=1 Tax=Clostridium sediminicola TaxID=3114879 RepID=UPI0031F239F0